MHPLQHTGAHKTEGGFTIQGIWLKSMALNGWGCVVWGFDEMYL